jgi:hypothetical protein
MGCFCYCISLSLSLAHSKNAEGMLRRESDRVSSARSFVQQKTYTDNRTSHVDAAREET